jgi:hypothetical protein
VVKAVGRQIKLWREAAGLRQVDLGAVIGYGGDAVESWKPFRRSAPPARPASSPSVRHARA